MYYLVCLRPLSSVTAPRASGQQRAPHRAGQPFKQSPGLASPIAIPPALRKMGVLARLLNAGECCLLMDSEAKLSVAWSVRCSAGMRQFDVSSPLLKDNLWQCDEEGKKRIDSAREANHTRVFQQRPALTVLTEAVRKQDYSDEGAIQWAEETVACGSTDLWQVKPERRSPFIAAYARSEGQQWQEHYPQMPAGESEHRLARYGLNSCVTGDTWVLTTAGPRQVWQLVGEAHQTIVHGFSYATTGAGFFYTGRRTTICLETQEGYSLKSTADHKVQRFLHRNPEGREFFEWVPAGNLIPGDRIALHNHRGVEPWPGEGTWEEGHNLGSFIAQGIPVEEEKEAMLKPVADYLQAEALCVSEAVDVARVFFTVDEAAGDRWQMEDLEALALRFEVGLNSIISERIERASYAFYCGFLQSLFDSAGELEFTDQTLKLVPPRENACFLQSVQRLLARIGIMTIRREGTALSITGDNLRIFLQIVGTRLPEHNRKLQTLVASQKLPSESFLATVRETDPIGQEEVYDCTVPLVQCFCANGIVAHNCGDLGVAR